MNIFEEIKKLNFDPNEYVVMGGAALAARGLKETNDIDIIITQELLNKCKIDGWEDHPRINPDEQHGLHKGVVELYPNVGHPNFNQSFNELRENAEIIDNIPFCNLLDVIKIKESYGREKDLIDVEKIKKYLKNK